MCNGRGGGGGSDGDGTVSDVLARGAVHLSVSRLYGCRQGLHAVDALRGVGQAWLGANAGPRPGATVHVGILGGLGAALGRDRYERFGRGGPWWDGGRRFLVSGDA